MTDYAELHCHSYYSFGDGASSPEALVEQAKSLGLRALALTDHDSLAGAIRFWTAARQADLQPIIGAEVTLDDGQHLTLLAETQHGYANLCRLISEAHLHDASIDTTPWPGKGEPSLSWTMLEQHHEGLLVLSGCRQGVVAAPLLRGEPELARAMALRLCDLFGREQVWIEVQQHQLPDDDRLIRASLSLAQSLDLPCVATNDVHYATAREARLRDALIAVRHIQPLDETRRAGLLPLNHTYHLASPDVMMQRFAEVPEAISNTLAIVERCTTSPLSLDFAQQRLPRFPTPSNCDEFTYLARLCHEHLPRRYPRYTPEVLEQLNRELFVIQKVGLAGYFLSVWDIVRFAREQGIRCQGRGSAANSLVAYLLSITNVDPIQHHLLFERFLSEDAHTIPDIDIDFAHDRREEVIQYVYAHYGREHTAMVCNVVTYKARLALRDLGKALGFPLSVIERLSKSIDAYSCTEAARQLSETIETDAPDNHPIRLLVELLQMIEDCPRHLSIHVGGMLITALPLNEVVPLERATMPGRIVCQWDKDNIEDAGLIKIDLLSLRTLGMISEAVRSIPNAPDLNALPLDDPSLFDMLQRADTIGAFQVESRAQQQMLPRLRPTCFEDIAVDIAIVRPGPIQGGAVHPYLRRRAGDEPVTYTHPSLEPVLRETMGVLLFQEQTLRVAMVASGFSASEADMLRRAMSRGRSFEAMAAIRERFIAGAERNAIARDTAEAIWHQLEGFAGYGFCKSHAMSFALIAYQTLYLKRYHPAAFYCALLNAQPMGFYSSEVVLQDARRHGIRLLPPDVRVSEWHYTVERPTYLRMGLRTVTGIGEQAWLRIQTARAERAFARLDDFCQRTHLPSSIISDLIRAGALDAFGKRRDLLWRLGGIEYRPDELPLVMPEMPVELPELDDMEQTHWEYELLGLSPHAQMMRHYRHALNRAGILSSVEVKQQPNRRTVRVGGMAVVKQRPGTAKGILFVSLEDELGMVDLVVKPDVFDQYRSLLHHQTFILVEGVVQKANAVVSVLVSRAMSFAPFLSDKASRPPSEENNSPDG